MKTKTLIAIVLIIWGCEKEVVEPHNPFVGNWEVSHFNYEFETAPKNIIISLEIDHSRPLDLTVEDDNGDPDYPCHINVARTSFTEDLFIQTTNYLFEGECVNKSTYEYVYQFTKLNDTLYNMAFYKSYIFSHELETEIKFDPPEFVDQSNVIAKENELIYILPTANGFLVDGRQPIRLFYHLKRIE